MSETVIISVGGSLIVPEEIDISFLKEFKDLIQNQIEEGKQFAIVTGGGQTARKYQEAASEIIDLTDEDVDWLGIHATRLNAHLMRTIFYREAHPRIVDDYSKDVDFEEDILIGSGWKPGCSTDYDAVLLAEKLNADKLLNLSDISYVYDKDPSSNSEAIPFESLSWNEFIDLLPDDWNPGLNAPFDPVAAEKAKELDLEVVILNGSNLENVENYLNGSEFEGTVIKH